MTSGFGWKMLREAPTWERMSVSTASRSTGEVLTAILCGMSGMAVARSVAGSYGVGGAQPGRW